MDVVVLGIVSSWCQRGSIPTTHGDSAFSTMIDVAAVYNVVSSALNAHCFVPYITDRAANDFAVPSVSNRYC